MGLLNLTESERLEILNLHNNARIIKEQVAPTVPAAAGTPAAAPQTVADVIKELQTLLNTKYGTKLVVDGKWGNLTQTAFETALKSKSAAPAGTSGTGTPAATAPTAAAPTAAAPTAAAPTAATPTAAAPTAAAPTAAAPTAAAPTAASPTAAAPTAAAPTAAAPTAAAPTAAAPTAAPDVVGAEAPQQLSQASQQALGGQLTPKQIRQQSRFDQRLARQARRTEKRAQQ
jgi:hypothetical protein